MCAVERAVRTAADISVIVKKLIWSVCGRYVVGMWSVCGWHVVGMWSVFGQYAVGMWLVCGRYVVVKWSVKFTHRRYVVCEVRCVVSMWTLNQINLFPIADVSNLSRLSKRIVTLT